MQRCIYAIPNGSLFHSEEMMKLEKDVEESRVSPTAFRTKLQVSFIFVNIYTCICNFFPLLFFHYDSFCFSCLILEMFIIYLFFIFVGFGFRIEE
jgi:cellulose synthase/poly-beta-1,6-N-acetylglucosamine synthase-like glycosyltransferase